MENLRGKIVEIERNIHTISYVATGIKKDKQRKFDCDEDAHGGNGTYNVGNEYSGTTIDVKIFVYDLNKCVSFDIRDYLLFSSNKSKISSKLLDYVVEQNKGKKVYVNVTNNEVGFDMKQLKTS